MRKQTKNIGRRRKEQSEWYKKSFKDRMQKWREMLERDVEGTVKLNTTSELAKYATEAGYNRLNNICYTTADGKKIRSMLLLEPLEKLYLVRQFTREQMLHYGMGDSPHHATPTKLINVLNRDDCTSSSNIKYTSHATLEVGPERRRDHTDLTNVVTFPLSSFQERRLSRVQLVVKHPAPEAARCFVERMSELATIQHAFEYSRETVAPIGYSEFVSVH
uniref:Uncharacterized protein n=1 Tax=Timema douglasi TaxID=61478 RepID=A0A7R8VBL3_TIMDO|nr:unnamed protein product [Timema douglasi]